MRTGLFEEILVVEQDRSGLLDRVGLGNVGWDRIELVGSGVRFRGLVLFHDVGLGELGVELPERGFRRGLVGIEVVR